MSRSTRSLHAWLLVSPFVLTLAVFFLFAMARAVYFSFTDYNLFDAANWTGLGNFVDLFSDHQFVSALANTLAFSVIVTTLQTLLALALAVVVSGSFFGSRVFRVAFFVPAILSSASVTLIFIWFYQENGLLNGMLALLTTHRTGISVALAITLSFMLVWHGAGLLRGARTREALNKFKFRWVARRIRGKAETYQADRRGLSEDATQLDAKGGLVQSLPRFFEPAAALYGVGVAIAITLILMRSGFITASPADIKVNWLGTREHIGPLPRTMWAIVIQNVYTTVPTFMLLFIAGLHGIPKDLYDAARVDGADAWQRFLHVTVPQLAPVTFVVVTFGVIGTLQTFDQVALLGDTSPLESRITLAYYVYHNAFPPGGEPKIGTASAAALVLAAITLAIIYLQKLLGIREKANV